MRSGLRRAAILAVFLSGVAAAAAAPDLPPPERQQALLRLLAHDCGSCHGMTMNGGLGPPLLPAALAGKSDEQLAAIILEGVAGTPMPPWSFTLAPEEALWLVGRLRAGTDDAR